jgi:hypothetical protein
LVYVSAGQKSAALSNADWAAELMTQEHYCFWFTSKADGTRTAIAAAFAALFAIADGLLVGH